MKPNAPNGDRPTKKIGKGPAILTLAVFAVVASAGIMLRMKEASSLDAATEDASVISVVVMKAPQGPATEDIVLPGNVQAWHEAPIFARTSGYLKDWKTDIGSHVKGGDILAEIDTPEIDAQLNQAQADVGTAEANNKLAQSTAARWENLLKTNSVSTQDAEEKTSAAAASAATVASAQANLDRLKQLENFKTMVAPFDGVITARNTDVGALINAGSGAAAPELFHIVETDKLRIYVQVPETYVRAITPDVTAELHFAEHPGEVFPAKLTSTADALDSVTRTLLIELEVDNAKGELMPGGYAEVHLKLASSVSTVRLPVNTLIFRAEGMQVATIDADGHALLKPIKISRDFGNSVEVQSGIAPGEKIIVNPPDSLISGQSVRVVSDGDKEGGNNEKSGDNGNGKDK